MSKTAETNALEMSDEDFMKNPSLFDSDSDENTNTIDDEDHDESGADTDADVDADEDTATDENTDDGTTEKDSKSSDEEDAGDSADGSDGHEESGDQNDTDVSNQDKDQDPEPAEGELTNEQYAEVGRQVMSEFKANGTTMKVKSVEDALQLMQMGANYHKKMTGLKPSLKTLKLLENNDLLDPEKLNYLIDLSQKKPEAIKQLLKESKLDPMTIDLEEETNYSPAKRTVSDTEMALEEVLNSISDSPTYDRTLNVLSEEWDDASRKSISAAPEIIGVINAHLQNGIYDQVASAVAYERSLGKLTGISDLEAYQRVGAYMNENNMFKGSAVKQPPEANQERQEQKPQDTKNVQQNSQQNDERKSRKKAASPSRQGPASVNKTDDYSPLNMSDEEFAKINNLSL